MAKETPGKKTHKEWRKEVKKLRRKKIRQKLAVERNKKLAEEEATRLIDPEYQAWLQEQEQFEAIQLEQEERERQEQEELWIRRELIAQKIFREQKRKYEATLATKEAERLRIQKEFEELQQQAQKRREERKKREEQAKKEHEQLLEKIAEYIEFGGVIPEELKYNVQSNPNKPICPFFSKTNACRFGMQCCRNHIRPKLSKTLFFPNFFSHIKLEQSQETEYGCDVNLEYTEHEVNHAYMEFFNDVIEELKKYGDVENFRTCMNSQPHLRGNVLVEYKNERDALRAHNKLQGRYYASRQINVEFSPIVSWKIAICGLFYSNKCPKGRNCNFLHIFRNPGNAYNVSVFKQEASTRNTSQRENRDKTVISWDDDNDRSSRRDWRWSESPEPDLNRKTNGNRRSPDTQSRKRREPSSSRSERHRGRERKHISSRSERNRSSERKFNCDKKYRRSRSRSKKRNSSCSSRDLSSRRRETRCSKSKSPTSPSSRDFSSRRRETICSKSKSPTSPSSRDFSIRRRETRCSKSKSPTSPSSRDFSIRRRETRCSKSKSPTSPPKRHKEKDRKKHHKDKKHKHNSRKNHSS